MTTYRVRCFDGFAALPPAHRAMLETRAARDFFCDPVWLEYLIAHFYPDRHRLCVYAVENAAGVPVLLMPWRACRVDYSAFGAPTLGSISHPENYAPVAMWFDAPENERLAALIALFRHLRSAGQVMLRIWPVDVESDDGRLLGQALHRAGLLVQRYENSFNRYEDTAGLDYEAYFAGRSANLRYSVRRRQRALEKSGRLELALYRETGPELEAAIVDYARVAAGSWKEAESMTSPDVLVLIRLCAAKDCLRLGILRTNGEPAAAQFWIVAGGVAHCARLAYHEEYRHQAVGVVLTNFMISRVLDDDRVERIDFGYGEEGYKGGWMKSARDYYGFLAFNPSTRAGLWHGARNILGRPVKRLAKALLVRFGLRTPDAEPAVRGRAGAR